MDNCIGLFQCLPYIGIKTYFPGELMKDVHVMNIFAFEIQLQNLLKLLLYLDKSNKFINFSYVIIIFPIIFLF